MFLLGVFMKVKNLVLGAVLSASVISAFAVNNASAKTNNATAVVESTPYLVQRQDIVQNLPNTIVFHQNESTVDPSLLFVLKWNASYIRAFPSAKIKIIGHSTDYENNVKDEALAMERAQNVRTVLFLLGVPFENTDIVSEGSRDPMFAVESAGVRQARNNRVDIFYTANPPKGYRIDNIPVVKIDTYEQAIIPVKF